MSIRYFDYQQAAVEGIKAQRLPARACLYFKTGAGKTITSLAQLAALGYQHAVVIAPPSTHKDWGATAVGMGMRVECISHAKFRMAGTKLSRWVPVIADEFHLFGGQGGKGFSKFRTYARHLQAPLIMLSATPNYNDAERCYCIETILDPQGTKGGFLAWLYQHCNTTQNMYGMTPRVDEDQPFRLFKNAAEYLASLPGVYYVEDDLVYQIQDVPFNTPMPWAYDVFGYNERKHRIVASQMEEKHTRIFQERVGKDGLLHQHIFDELMWRLSDLGPTLVYANHATVAEAAARTLGKHNVQYRIVTGDDSKKDKARRIQEFKDGLVEVLVGTATLATGTDGLDKVCDRLVILDDTEDDSLRRQLIGRIMPRGSDTDASKKQVYRLIQLP